MTLNDQIDALVLKNKVINPVNMTTFKNPFLLLSTTRALNELVSNTAPSDRARQQGIEDDKAYLKTPSGARSDRKAPKKDEKQDTQQTPPKQKANAKPTTSSVKTPKTASVPTKESKTASKKLVTDALKGGMEKVLSAKGVADKILTRQDGKPDGRSAAARAAKKAAAEKAIKDAGKEVVKIAKAARAKADKADVESEAKKQAANKAEVKRLKKVKADADAETKALKSRREGDAIPLGNTRVRSGNSSDRRLGTKTQKKKK